jgi:hypothetical protein
MTPKHAHRYISEAIVDLKTALDLIEEQKTKCVVGTQSQGTATSQE